MDPISLLILLGAGLAAGFVAGLIGVGGGVIFAPVLLFYYQAIGVPADVVAPLTIGSSLFCTLLAAVASAWTQYTRNSVLTRVALTVGGFSAFAVFLTTRYVTTQPWYDGDTFKIVFSLVLLTVVARMIVRPSVADPGATADPPGAVAIAAGAPMGDGPETHRFGWPMLAGAGTAAGAVSAAAGVGGGVVLVPSYSHFMRLPIHLATGTSSATIVIISLVGVVNYVLHGWGEAELFGAIGYVDVVRGLVIAAPSIVTARFGVQVAHRINQRALRISFAAIAAVVAARLLLDAMR